MGLRDKAYAKIWSAKPIGKIFSVRATVSRKNKDTGEYETQFGGFINFAGEAAKKVKELGLPEQMDRNDPHPRSIQISSPDITNHYNAQYINRLLSLAKGIEELEKFIRNNASPYSVTIWDFELAEGDGGGRSGSKNARKTSKRREPEPDDNEEEDSDLPF